jgi:DNA-binding IscR family transcriptional regulator
MSLLPRKGLLAIVAVIDVALNARERRRISVADVLRAAGNDEDEQGPKSSHILDEIVLPALADAERAFTVALAQLSIEDLARRAESLRDR